MSPQRRAPRRRKKIGRRRFLVGLGCAAGAYFLYRSVRNVEKIDPPAVLQPDETPNPALPSGEWRAVWVSYLEWARMDFSSEAAFRADIAALMDNCAALGLNTVLAQVRPFGDALYESSLFPWSHLCTGTQGQAPGFDPLDVLITEAHARGLSLEAWINPYRLKSSAAMPPSIGETNLMHIHPEWCCTVGEGVYLNPAIPEAAAYVVQGVAELVERYAVDGIHFDDYFYPTTEASLDAAQFAASGEKDLASWRQQNVTSLVKAAHDAVKAADPTLRFGVSPQGNPENDLATQYSDIYTWLTASGADAVVDYLCPQVYFGLEHGSCPFAETCREFSDMAKAGNIPLIIGMTSEKAWAASCGKTDIWAGAGKNEWLEHRDILFRCLKVTQTVPGCVGVSLFGYRLFFDPITGQKIPGTAEEAAALFAALPDATWEIPYQTAP